MAAEAKGERMSPTDEGSQEVPQVIPDSVLLQDFVPEEIWELISRKVLKKGSKDHQDLVDSSQFFRNLRPSKRTILLFEQVFPLVLKSVWEREGEEGFSLKDLLKYRVVCPMWNAVIDNLLHQVSPDDRLIECYFSLTKDTHHGFGAKKTVEDFMQHFDPTLHQRNQINGRNPFIWGKVHFFLCPYEYDDSEEEAMAAQRYLEKVTEMIAKYGQHVHDFDLVTETSVFANLSLFRDWLVQMPNLKVLTLLDFLAREANGEINLEDYPLPKLRVLERIDAYGVLPQIFNELLRNNDHISKLMVSFKEDYNVFTVALPNLTEFRIAQTPDDIVERLASPEVQWPLETLELEHFGAVSAATLFQVIRNKFANTLVSLDLWFTADGVESELWQNCKTFRLDLPKLKNIRLDLGETPVCLDFLLPMIHNLEKISARYKVELPHPLSTGIIQYVGFEERMLESNIWGIFEKLKEVEVFTFYKRNFFDPNKRCYFRKDLILSQNNA